MMPNTVRLYLARADDFDEAFFRSLSPVAADGQQKKESALAWAIVRMLCKRRGVPPEFTFGAKGKPFVKGNPFYFSISHSNGFVLVAESDHPLGADTELVTGKDHSRIYPRVLNKNELVAIKGRDDENELFFRLWTLKESTLKQSGEGLSGGMAGLDFSGFLFENSFELNGLHYHCEKTGGFMVAVCCENSFETEKIRICKEIKND